MSAFWIGWVCVLTLTNLALVIWVLEANKRVAKDDTEAPENKTTGHVFDGLEEYDNPLPKWWYQMFWGTLIFGAIYLAAYPGLLGSSWNGLLGWTQVGQYEKEIDSATEKYGPIYAKYAAMSIEDVAQDPKALKMGTRIFANNCAVCHGSTGGGYHGFPNLTDNDWLWGGSPETIKETITHGRGQAGVMRMPAWGDQWALSEGVARADQMVTEVTEYVLSIAGEEHDAAQAAAGADVYASSCVACHGADGKGLQALGAPNLTDDIWLFNNPGWSLRDNVSHSIRKGRGAVMPAQKDMLQADKIHLLSAYVYSLSQEN
ncbi:MAG: cytochrome-c oxidase, cbb3-type subunit III [Cellvibrionaceae bacterium]